MPARRSNWFVWWLHFMIGAFLGVVIAAIMWLMNRPRSITRTYPDHWKTCLYCRAGRYLNLHTWLGEPDFALFCSGLALIGAGIVCLFGNRIWFGRRNIALDLAPEHSSESRRISIGVVALGFLVLAYAAIFT